MRAKRWVWSTPRARAGDPCHNVSINMARNLIKKTPVTELDQGTMLLALSGWMDGGDVSTETVRRLAEHLGAHEIAQIDPEAFFIFNFPGSMDIAALFRPHVKIDNGFVNEFDLPENSFYCDQENNLIFFVGKEPNMRWREFGEYIFEVASEAKVSRILFVGSVAGTVPHTREPRLFATVSDLKLGAMLGKAGVRPTNYAGPGSFITYLMTHAEQRGFEMASIVAEIPAYLQGTNPLSIEAVTRRLSIILDLKLDFDAMRGESNAWEIQVSEAVEKDDELAKKIRKLEEQYDDELIDASASDEWDAGRQ
ncbi:MAG: PAC2 family protein [Phycisphaeraceae bacterium]|nr:PAC2 family protein [Phycisphaeraceae bacterium]